MKSERLKWIGFISTVVFICGLMLLPGAAMAKKNTPFTADHITTGPDGSQIKGKIYASQDKIRMEMKQPGMPGTMIVIYSKKDNTVTMAMKSTKRYFMMPMGEDPMGKLPGDVPPSKKKKLGSETVNGYSCTKYEVLNEMNIMGQKQTFKLLVWESSKFAYPIKTKSPEGATQELRNIKEGNPPASMFKMPAGYKKAANMMELMMPGK